MTTRFSPQLVPALAPAADRSSTGAPRVLLVGAQPFMSWALGQHLTATLGAEVHDVADADAAAAALAHEHCDAVVLDGADELPSLLARFRAIRPQLAVVVLRGGPLGASRTLAPVDAAVRFLPPRAGADDLVEALRATIAHASLVTRGTRRPAARATSAPLTLSPRELQVLELLRDGHSLPSVAATLAISMSTTKTYVARLYDKLEATSRTQALLKALRLGLLQPETQRAG